MKENNQAKNIFLKLNNRKHSKKNNFRLIKLVEKNFLT
jgi:hypothetical protein